MNHDTAARSEPLTAFPKPAGAASPAESAQLICQCVRAVIYHTHHVNLSLRV